ncbi:hypothetical protein GCM10028808_15710 [Spirosoma migulaei]
MKSLFPYFVMIVLFLAGTRLVNRQQTYIRSIQESSDADTAALTSMIDSANVYVRADYSLASGRNKLIANRPETDE